MMKQEVVKRGWLSDAQSSKKLKGEWKKASTLGMHLSAKYSGAREPKFANVDLILPVVVVGKREWWAGWFDCTQWHCSSFGVFHEWISAEATIPHAPAPVTDLKQWLDTHAADLRLLLLFVVEHAHEVFDLLDKAQVSVASTFCGNGDLRRPKPTMHRVFNRFHKLHCTLQQILDRVWRREHTRPMSPFVSMV